MVYHKIHVKIPQHLKTCINNCFYTSSIQNTYNSNIYQHFKIYGIKCNKFVRLAKIKTCSTYFYYDLNYDYDIYCVAYNYHDNNNNKTTLFNIFKNYHEYRNPIIYIDERTTVANIFCFAKFLHICKNGVCIKGCKIKLNIAYGLKKNFIHDNGDVSDVIKNSPNGLQTNSYPLLNYLSNLIYYSILDSEVRTKFLNLTCSDSISQGILTLANKPFTNVLEIYSLISEKPTFYKPALNQLTLPQWKSPIPDQWTLALKFNNNGSKNFIMGGPGYIAFDENNRVWINNNTRQGTPNSSTFCTVLESDGSPTEFSPIFGGGLLGAGFGISSTKKGDKICIGNFGWGSTDYNPQNGSVSIIKSSGKILTPSNGYINGINRVQGLYYDNNDNLWMTSWGSQEPLGGIGETTFNFESVNCAITVYIKGNPNNWLKYEFDNPYKGTFDVVSDEEGNIYVSNAGNEKMNQPSSIYHFRLEHDKIVKINSWISDNVATNGFEAFRQVNISPDGYVFVVALVTSRIIKFDKCLNYITSIGNVDGPWGVEFNNKGTMYISNFRKDTIVINTETYDMAGKFGVSVIFNENENSSKLVTLPTGGDEVILDNGLPLYGNKDKPSYEPLMRITGSKLDVIGNLWSVNNWKPSLIGDFQGNPGGDGVVVFINLGNINY